MSIFGTPFPVSLFSAQLRVDVGNRGLGFMGKLLMFVAMLEHRRLTSCNQS